MMSYGGGLPSITMRTFKPRRISQKQITTIKTRSTPIITVHFLQILGPPVVFLRILDSLSIPPHYLPKTPLLNIPAHIAKIADTATEYSWNQRP